jgi:gluconate kinase
MKPLTAESPHAIVMVGIPGAGKSEFAEQFAKTFQALLVNRTKYQRELGLDESQADFLFEVMVAEFFKSKRTLIIETSTQTKEQRDALKKRLTKAGYQTLFVWVQTDTGEAFRRATRPYPKGSDMDSALFDELVSQFEAPIPREKAVVISGKHTYQTQLKIVLKQLALKTRHANAGHPSTDGPTRISVRR